MAKKKPVRLAMLGAGLALIVSSAYVLSEPIGDLIARRSDTATVKQAVRPPLSGRVEDRVLHAAPSERTVRTRHYSAEDSNPIRRLVDKFFPFNGYRFLRTNGEAPQGGTSPLVPDID